MGSIGALRGEDVPEALLEDHAHLHISSYFLQQGLRPSCRELFARARRKGLTTSLDPGFDPAETWDDGLRATLEHVDLFFPNEVELRGITGQADPVDALRALENGRTRTVGISRNYLPPLRSCAARSASLHNCPYRSSI